MIRRARILTLLIWLLLPGAASAQLFPSTTGVIETTPATTDLRGSADLVVEGETYKPVFYRGRAEPTVGNIVRLIAVPHGQSPQNFSYQWNVGGQALSATGPVATFSDLFSDKLRVSVNIVDKTGALFARIDEIVELSKPQVVFYEENILRGHGSRAITDSHTLIGDEGVIRAEPYFIGLRTDTASYRATWKVDGQLADSGGDWRQLLLERPQDPLTNYRIDFAASNRNNLAEVVSGRFNLNFGL